MMKTLAEGLTVLQAAIRDTHTSRSPERRRALFGVVEHFQGDALEPVRPTASLHDAMKILRRDVLAYSRTRQSEQEQRDILFRALGVDLSEVGVAAEHATLDEEAELIRPDYDTSRVPNPIQSSEWR